MDEELSTGKEMTAEVCVVDTGGTVAAVVVATDTGVTMGVDTCVVGTTFVVATVKDFSGDVVVVTVGSGAGVAAVEVVIWGGVLTVFSAVVEGVVVCSLEGDASTKGVVTWTPSVAGDVVTVTVFASAVVETLADVVVGEEVIGEGAAGGFSEDSAIETVVTGACVDT